MKVIVPAHDRAADVSDVPEFGAAVIASSGQIILTVGIEIEISYRFVTVGVFDVINRSFVD